MTGYRLNPPVEGILIAKRLDVAMACHHCDLPSVGVISSLE